MLRQQVCWLKNFNGKINLDYIGKFEDLDIVFKNISSQLSIKNLDFPHEKKSKKIDYKMYFNDESIDIVTKYYKDDLETFNYKFK